MGVVMLLAEGEATIARRCCCWAVSVSIGELRPDVSTDLEEEWAEWGMWLWRKRLSSWRGPMCCLPFLMEPSGVEAIEWGV